MRDLERRSTGPQSVTRDRFDLRFDDTRVQAQLDNDDFWYGVVG